MKFKRIKVITLALCLIVLISGCTSQTPNETENKEINLGLMSDTAGIPLIVAQELGYFKEEKVDINLNVFFSAMDRDAAVQANQLNSMVSDLISVGLLEESGNNFVVVSKTETEYKLLSSPEQNNINLDSFDNKKIGLSTNTLMEYLVDMTISKNNLKNIEKVNIPKMPNRLEMLNNNQIDGAILPEPLASLSEQKGSKVLLSNKDLNLYPGVLLFNEAFVKENKDEMKGFVSAYNKAVDYINKNGIQEFSTQINEKLSFSEEAFATFKDAKYTQLSLPDNDSVTSAMNWLYEKKLISKLYTFDQVTYDISK